MDDLKGFPTFQYSEFVGGRDGGQFVVRANSAKELEDGVRSWKENKYLSSLGTPQLPTPQEVMASKQTFGQGIPPTVVPSTAGVPSQNVVAPNAPVCPVHQKPMRWKFGRWGCSQPVEKDANGNVTKWCSITIPASLT